MTFDEVRQQYPQYSDLSDEQLALGLHKKFYADMPWGTFMEKVGLKPQGEDPGAIMSGVIGAGRVLDQVVKGGQQAYYGLKGSAEELAKLKTQEDENKRIYSGLEKLRPTATTVGEIGALSAGVPLATTLGGAALAGAAPGLLSYGTAEEKALNAVGGGVGGFAGAGVGKLLGRVVQPFRSAPSESQQAAQAAAARLGVNLRAGEITQSRPLRWMESNLNDMPFASGLAQTEESARRAAINAAGARELGQQAQEITPAVLAKARADTGQTIDSLLANRRIELGPSFRQDMAKITDSKVLKELRDESVDKLIEPFRNMPQGKIKVSGEWFQENKTALDTAIRAAYNSSQPGRAMALQDFERALVKAAKDSMNPTERATLDAAYRQWATLRLLETGKVVEGGNIMPGRLDAALLARYKGAYKEGKIPGALADIGKLGEVYKPLPQSGTAPRALYSAAAMGSGLLHPMLTAGMLAGPAIAQRALQSKMGKTYLTKGMLNVSPEAEQWLAKGGYGLLGSPLSLELSP